MTLRSGTNSLRGSTIGLYRGTALDSNQIQNIRNNISNEGHTYYNNETMVSGPIRRSKTFFMGGYQGFYENIPFPVTRTVPTDAPAPGRLLPDDDRERHADRHLRPGDDALERRRRVHPRSDPVQRPAQRDLPGPLPSRGQDAAAVLPPPERRAEQPRGERQLRQLAERRALPLQLVPDADRPQLQHPAPAVVHQHRELGDRVPQRERPARAGHPQRQLADAPQPLPRRRWTTT